MVMSRLKRMIFRKPVFARSAKRYSCALDASMIRVDRMTNVDGRVVNISLGGAMFRPRRSYLMEVHEVAVCLKLDEFELFGHIVSTTPMGYGIRFDSPIADGDMEQIIARFALEDVRAAA